MKKRKRRKILKREEEILIEVAKKSGIDIEGKTIEQIAEEVLRKVKGKKEKMD